MSEETLPRETGSEKVKLACPSCGKELPAVESEYGSVSAGACPSCGKEAKAADKEETKKAEEEAAKAEEAGTPEPEHPQA